ncbi:hypothetical protein CSPAE12_05293 [Colletotrichum incanum]|nr:hypothetical protein CSPAE12_05293 [Colletotrichum incanum]
MPSGRIRTLDPASPTSTSPEDNEQVNISYEADESSSSWEEVYSDEYEEQFDELPSTPILRRESQANKRNPQTPKNKMSAVTPSTKTTGQSPADLFVDDSTPRNDNPIFFNLSNAPRANSPDLGTGSSSHSSVPSTPTKTAGERHRPTSFRSKLISHAEALREVRHVIVEINVTKAEYKRVRGLFEHLMRDENATPSLLEASVDTTSSRLVRAVEDDDRIQNGNPPRHLPYPPEMIPELLAAVEKAEADRDNWYAETKRLFWLIESIDKRKMPALKLKLEAARKNEAAARQRESVLAAAVAYQKPFTPSGMFSGTGNPANSSPASARQFRPEETPIVTPVTSDFSNQTTVAQGIRDAMQRAPDADALETPTKKARR